MADKSLAMLTKTFFKDRFLILLVSFMGLMVISPMLEGLIRLKMLMDVFITLVFICSIYAVSSKKVLYLFPNLSALSIKPACPPQRKPQNLNLPYCTLVQ
jgi:hypothetical protein